ncbi:MAG: winged helix-turn-helix transcriptional regulator [Clostridia bacterium]
MPIDLRDTDIAVLNALLRDGRKSLRQISKDTGISTPTVRNRFNRLINLGVIKSISPILDLNKITYTNRKKKNNKGRDIEYIASKYKQHHYQQLQNNTKKKTHIQFEKGMAVNLNCDYCKTPLAGKMYMFKVGNFERFFCCNECKISYKKKYSGRIRAISKSSSYIRH